MEFSKSDSSLDSLFGRIDVSINIDGNFSYNIKALNFFISILDFSLLISPSKEILPFPSVNKTKEGEKPFDLIFLLRLKTENKAEAKGVVPQPGNAANFFLVCTRDFVGGKRISAFFPLNEINETKSRLE